MECFACFLVFSIITFLKWCLVTEKMYEKLPGNMVLHDRKIPIN